ncbi:hypothetical protein OIU78_003469 [Salix suchowensis]|nr:hypothetical protein OIU78_003469 [Salix suchowensis]
MEAVVLYGFAIDNPVGTLTNDQKNATIPDCLAPFRTVVGCLDSISDALSGEDFLDIAPDCCEVVTSIDKECFSFLFPKNSSAPSIIVGLCDIIERCCKEIYVAISTGTGAPVGPACCEVNDELADFCWTRRL